MVRRANRQAKPWRVCVLALVAVCATVLAAAQAAPKKDEPGPKYDVKTEVTLKGTVVDVKQVTDPKGDPSMRLMFKSGADTLEVFLCPESFLQEVGFGFNKGDELEIKGAKVKFQDQWIVLAREIVKGNDTLVLRDPQGVPVWGWSKKG